MTDLISREAAINVVKGIDSGFVKYIEALPSQIDLIRCSECKHVRRYVIGSKRHWCAVHDTVTNLGDFCSWAERDA